MLLDLKGDPCQRLPSAKTPIVLNVAVDPNQYLTCTLKAGGKGLSI